jgi:hypothetical protein
MAFKNIMDSQIKDADSLIQLTNKLLKDFPNDIGLTIALSQITHHRKKLNLYKECPNCIEKHRCLDVDNFYCDEMARSN